MSREPPIYLDYNATTPVDPRVFERMRPWFVERFGNAASRHHERGRAAARAVDEARAQVAALIGADPREIVFTSGATEANNLALKGVMRSPVYPAAKDHLVIAATEHKAVLDPAETLEREGRGVTRLRVDGEGRIDLDQLADAIGDRTRLVSLMHANNEIGVVHPIDEIGALCKRRGVLLHTDATQSVGKLPVDVQAMQVDLLSCSAHKLYGPKGIGALWVRRKGPRVRCRAEIDGGGHEGGRRSGTLNVPAIVGLGAAAELAAAELESEAMRLAVLRDRLEHALLGRLEGVSRNGPASGRLPGTSNLSFAGVEAESLVLRMPRIEISTSAACSSAARAPSYVLAALGADDARIAGSLRFSLGRPTTAAEIEQAVDCVVRAAVEERAQGPLSACR